MIKKSAFKIFFLLSMTSIVFLTVLSDKHSISQFQPFPAITTNKSFRNIEPDEPVNLNDPPFYSQPFPKNEVSTQTVINNGKEVSFEFIYNDPHWQRQSYKEYWHSSYSRWSYTPNRIHYAMHRIFATYPTASMYYDFIHDLGIAQESLDFKQYSSSSTSPYQYLEVVIMNTSINQIYTYENQVVIVGRPQRLGLQAIIIPVNQLNPVDGTPEILIQLVTLSGDEIDYTSIAKVIPSDN